MTELDTLIALYQSLSMDQCSELYKKQRENMSMTIRRIVLSIIGAKAGYGAEYRPKYYQTLREEKAAKKAAEASNG